MIKEHKKRGINPHSKPNQKNRIVPTITAGLKMKKWRISVCPLVKEIHACGSNFIVVKREAAIIKIHRTNNPKTLLLVKEYCESNSSNVIGFQTLFSILSCVLCSILN